MVISRLGSALLWAMPAVALLHGAAASTDTGCEQLLPNPDSGSQAGLAMTPENLVRLREIGSFDTGASGSTPIALSPDGQQAAFILSQADPVANKYCRALLVVPVKPGGQPRIIDRGGEYIMLRGFVRGLSVAVGSPAPVTPKWSPDGSSIAYLRRDDGVTQAWLAAADGTNARAATHSAVDIEAIGWTRKGDGLVFASRPGAIIAQERITREARSGWLYDDRIVTNGGPRPRLGVNEAPLEMSVLDLESRLTRPATADEQTVLEQRNAISSSGRKAWIGPASDDVAAPLQLWAEQEDGRAVACKAEACSAVIGWWWSEDGRELRFLCREGWRAGFYAFYQWYPGSGSPVRLYSTEDVIENCLSLGDRLLCTVENSTTPRRIVLLDPRTGNSNLVFDPNPEVGRLALGSVQRLHVRSDHGLKAWADLVLPPDHQRGEKLPMIVVQYGSRGFLRGGTGNEYPIFPLAARGFAVLSFERPPSASRLVKGLKTDLEAQAADLHQWSDRRNTLSALERAVQAAIDTGQIDPSRIGITGLSDGATTVRFALINSDRFSAAAISSCCIEPVTSMTHAGMRFAQFLGKMGFPKLTAQSREFWRPMSIALNAAQIDTPLLMQLSDDEYLLALEPFQALHEHGQPVEMYVFPGEHHIKWQPTHRLAIYKRSIDWFDFWLRCHEDPDASKKGQYRRWRKMRAASKSARALCNA